MENERFNCPHCHSAVQFERYEQGYDGCFDYLVCPECDYVFFFAPAGPMTEREVFCLDG